MPTEDFHSSKHASKHEGIEAIYCVIRMGGHGTKRSKRGSEKKRKKLKHNSATLSLYLDSYVTLPFQDQIYSLNMSVNHNFCPLEGTQASCIWVGNSDVKWTKKNTGMEFQHNLTSG